MMTLCGGIAFAQRRPDMGIVVGTVLSVFFYQILLMLWRVFGHTSGAGLDLWAVIAAAIVLYVGANISSRAQVGMLGLTGAVHGLTVSALFFGSLILLGQLHYPAFYGLSPSDPRAYRAVETSIVDVMRNPVSIRSLEERLVDGDYVGAKIFLSKKTGLQGHMLDARMEGLRRTLAILQSTDTEEAYLRGRLAFSMLVLGALLGAIGGRDGRAAVLRLREPRRFGRDTRAA